MLGPWWRSQVILGLLILELSDVPCSGSEEEITGKEGTWHSWAGQGKGREVWGQQDQAGILLPDKQHRRLFPLEGADDRIHGEVFGGF